MAGDKGRYYLLEAKPEGVLVKALHGTGYTCTEINCKAMRIRDMGL